MTSDREAKDRAEKKIAKRRRWIEKTKLEIERGEKRLYIIL